MAKVGPPGMKASGRSCQRATLGQDPRSWRKLWGPRGLGARGLWAVHPPARWSPPAYQPPWGAAASGVLIWAPGAVAQILEAGFGESDFQAKRPELPSLLPGTTPRLGFCSPLQGPLQPPHPLLTASSDLGEADSPSGGPMGDEGAHPTGGGRGSLRTTLHTSDPSLGPTSAAWPPSLGPAKAGNSCGFVSSPGRRQPQPPRRLGAAAASRSPVSSL